MTRVKVGQIIDNAKILKKQIAAFSNVVLLEKFELLRALGAPFPEKSGKEFFQVRFIV